MTLKAYPRLPLRVLGLLVAAVVVLVIVQVLHQAKRHRDKLPEHFSLPLTDRFIKRPLNRILDALHVDNTAHMSVEFSEYQAHGGMSATANLQPTNDAPEPGTAADINDGEENGREVAGPGLTGEALDSDHQHQETLASAGTATQQPSGRAARRGADLTGESPLADKAPSPPQPFLDAADADVQPLVPPFRPASAYEEHGVELGQILLTVQPAPGLQNDSSANDVPGVRSDVDLSRETDAPTAAVHSGGGRGGREADGIGSGDSALAGTPLTPGDQTSAASSHPPGTGGASAAAAAARPAPGGASKRFSDMTKREQVAYTVGRMYRRKKTYAAFGGHVVMSKESVPRDGSRLKTPWYDYDTRRVRDLGRVTPELLRTLPERDPFRAGMYETCAVVGSAGLMLMEPFGAEIDAHSAVIRFNVAPVRGFEKFVGSRTDIRLVNRLHAFWRETANETVLQHVTMDDIMTRFVRRKRQAPEERLYALDMSFYAQTIQWQRVQTPTNGYFGMRLALHLCKQVDVYGFCRQWKGYFPYHYFNGEEPNSDQMQRDGRGGELPIIAEIVSNSSQITFKHPCILTDSCEGCPAVAATCDGRTPYAVPRPGFCRLKGGRCFAACPGGQKSCAGGRKAAWCTPDVIAANRSVALAEGGDSEWSQHCAKS